MAIDAFLSRLENFATRIDAKLKVGFSDDDENTINHMTDFFREKYGKEFTIKKWVINSLVGSSLLSLLFFCVKTISLIAAEIIDKGIMQ